MCIPGKEEEWEFRKKLTLKNAEEFYHLCENGNYSFDVIGTCQGWDIESYRDSLRELIDIGYGYIAIGGIARTRTEEIVKILWGIYDLVKEHKIKLHIFGVARLEAIKIFKKLGVVSFDSASPLRTAWLGFGKNYRALDWAGYTALRLPFLSKTKKYTDLAKKGIVSIAEMKEYEQSLQVMLRKFEFENSRTPEELVEAFHALNQRFIHELLFCTIL